MNPRYSFYQRPVVIEPVRTQVILPAFLLAVPAWVGASDILAQYEIGNVDYQFSFKLPIDAFGENFVAAIRWMDVENNLWIRYKLFDHEDAVLSYPVYSGQRIGLNAVLEIWSVNSDLEPTLDTAYTFQSSVLVYPPGEQSPGIYFCCVQPGQVIVLTPSSIPDLPPGQCNPFCFNLCATAPPMTCDCPTTVFDSYEALRAIELPIANPLLAFVLGHDIPGDGFGKMFYWDPLSSDDDNDNSVVRPTVIAADQQGRFLQYV